MVNRILPGSAARPRGGDATRSFAIRAAFSSLSDVRLAVGFLLPTL